MEMFTKFSLQTIHLLLCNRNMPLSIEHCNFVVGIRNLVVRTLNMYIFYFSSFKRPVEETDLSSFYVFIVLL